ncbi:hypothetical protein [Arenibaculum pallidiluteum]|uniref:hypothetical protein n=1 Tax=Arenibaculum pallidiluteum TaxID=2812559 RepID=UPI001A97A055|nr:hypothetical protein [Arenibaculum pallidiluteum]
MRLLHDVLESAAPAFGAWCATAGLSACAELPLVLSKDDEDASACNRQGNSDQDK